MKKFTASILTLTMIILADASSQQLAFPTAEGFGKFALGGRGGIVVEVKNLNDAGPGSLRQALTTNINQKRTIVFRISGTIELESVLKIDGDSYITIAGQTAPGDGICIKNFPLSIQNSHDLIIRYLRFRPGDEQDCGGNCDQIDAMSVRTSYNLILDHCSFSWSIDADLDLTVETGQSTVQYCILSEALLNSKHPSGAHSMAAGWDGQHGGASYHHNLIASCNSRTPRLDSYLGQISGERDRIDFVNNVIYNWAGYGAYGGEHADANWQNNYYRYGPSTGSSTGGKRDQIFQVDETCKLYLSGNYVEEYPAVCSDNSKGIYILGSKASATQLDTILMQDPFSVESIEMESAEESFNTVLAHAGASLPSRDSVDERIINDVNEQTGRLIDSPSDVGGWPVLSVTAAPTDNDHDGMPDDWETIMGFNSSDPEDRNLDHNGDGYTNLEEYLNGLIPEFSCIYRPGNLGASVVDNLIVELTWEDLSDNEEYFVLERKSGDQYEQIDSVSANTTIYLDTVPDYDRYTYRIKAIQSDLESLYTYSSRISVSEPQTILSSKSVAFFKCYPNPFTRTIDIYVTMKQTDEPSVFVFDLSGRNIKQLSGIEENKGQYHYSWDGLDLNGNMVPAGSYVICIQNDEERFTKVIAKH